MYIYMCIYVYTYNYNYNYNYNYIYISIGSTYWLCRSCILAVYRRYICCVLVIYWLYLVCVLAASWLFRDRIAGQPIYKKLHLARIELATFSV